MSRPIRVLEIISGFAVEGPLGGIERFGIELAQQLDRTKVEPILCGLWAYDTPYEQGWVDRLREAGIDAFIAGGLYDETSPYVSFRSALAGIQAHVPAVDIIHSHVQFGDGAALWHKRRLGARAIVRTVHNEREWPRRPARRAVLTNGIYPLVFDLELGVSQQVVDNLNARPLSRLRSKQALRAYNALNVDRFAAVTVDREKQLLALGIDPGKRVVGTIGRMTEQKGHTHLLHAAKQLLASAELNIVFVIIGDGDLATATRREAQDLGIDEHVHFTGPQQAIEQLLPCFDLFVNPSLWEGLPTVIMEAMAARVPVVATQVSGVAELITNQSMGLLVPAADPDAMAAGIREALDMPLSDREAMVDAAQRYVRDTFSISAVAKQHEQLYSAILA